MPNPKDLCARRTALKIPPTEMAIGLGLSPPDILSIEADALLVGHESEKADFYTYWLDRLERLTKEQLETQIGYARKGMRFR
jgi:hypothetical protein